MLTKMSNSNIDGFFNPVKIFIKFVFFMYIKFTLTLIVLVFPIMFPFFCPQSPVYSALRGKYKPTDSKNNSFLFFELGLLNRKINPKNFSKFTSLTSFFFISLTLCQL